MHKTSMTLSLAAALSFAITHAVEAHAPPEENMEQCKVVNKDGKNIIKETKSDCFTEKHGCAGMNAAGEKDAWIYVPNGMCKQINAGVWEEVRADICEKIEGCE